jgi:peptide methionine sulfoxide reductase msrA/msrB
MAALALLILSVSACGRTGTETRSGAAAAPATQTPTGGTGVKTIYLAGGCFWGMQGYLDKIRGVTATEVGYANGASNSAKYGDSSGYAESVKVDYDPSLAPLPFLLRLFYKAIDPTTLNRQGNDMGTEYRSGIYYTDPADRPVIDASLSILQTQYKAPIAIETGPLNTYSRAEDYHQDYLEKTPGGYCHIPLDLFTAAASARPEQSDFPTSQ